MDDQNVSYVAGRATNKGNARPPHRVRPDRVPVNFSIIAARKHFFLHRRSAEPFRVRNRSQTEIDPRLYVNIIEGDILCERIEDITLKGTVETTPMAANEEKKELEAVGTHRWQRLSRYRREQAAQRVISLLTLAADPKPDRFG